MLSATATTIALAVIADPAPASAPNDCEATSCTFGFTKPTIEASNGPFEFGLHFQADIPGYITQVCYWQASGDTNPLNPHHVILWNAGGSPLATATGAGTPNANNCFAFGSPVPIAANTDYTVSYNANAGTNALNFTADQFRFAGFDSGHLHAPIGAGGFAAPGVFPPIDLIFRSGYGVQPVFVTAPNAPTGVVATPTSPTSLSLAYTGDGVAGQNYDATCTSDTVGGPYVGSSSGTTGPISIVGMTFSPNQQLTCSVKETSGLGLQGPAGLAAAIFLYPNAPTGVSGTAVSPTSLNVAWTSDGATSATAVATCTSDSQGGSWTSGAPSGSSPLLVGGIPFSANQQISCTVKETAHSLTSAPSSASAAIFLYPNAPTAVSVSQASLTSVKVAFTGDGATAATFTATCTSSAGGPALMASGSTSPLTVNGFTNLAIQTITCSVTETAHSLTSAPSANAATVMFGASGPGCPATLTAPTKLSAVAEAFPGAVVSWAPATADPASCLVGYLVTPSSGSAVLVLGHGTTTLVKPLTLSSSVTFTVAAVSGSGVGPSATVGPVTIGAPAAVTAVHVARVGKGAVKVAFKPGKNNGAAIKRFTATCGSKSTSGKASPLIVKGLKAGKTYTCTVTATNSRGNSTRVRSANVKA